MKHQTRLNNHDSAIVAVRAKGSEAKELVEWRRIRNEGMQIKKKR